MKNIKILGLAIVASIVAAPAFAGETYVRNEWSNTKSYTDTNLYLNSHTNSTRNEAYGSFAYKEYTDGDVNVSKKGGWHSPKTVSYDDYSEHTAGSLLLGKFKETNYTGVSGNIKTYTHTNSDYHETSGGVR